MIFEYFARFIPEEKVVERMGQLRQIQGKMRGNDQMQFTAMMSNEMVEKWSETIPGALKIVIRLRH